MTLNTVWVFAEVADGVAVKLTYFKSETGDSTGSGTDVDRVFLDFTFKY